MSKAAAATATSELAPPAGARGDDVVGATGQPPDLTPPVQRSVRERLLRGFLLVDPVSRLNYLVVGGLIARRSGKPLLPYREAIDLFLDALFRGRAQGLGYYCEEARRHLATLVQSSSPADRRAALASLLDLATDPQLNAQLTQSDHLRRLIVAGLLHEALPRGQRESEVEAIVSGLEYIALHRVTQGGRTGEPSPEVQVTLIAGVRNALLQHHRALRAQETQRRWVGESAAVYQSVLRLAGSRSSLLYSAPVPAPAPFDPFPLPEPVASRLYALLAHYRDRHPVMPDSQAAAKRALDTLAAAADEP